MGLNSNPGQPPFLIPGLPSGMGNSVLVATDANGNLAASTIKAAAGSDTQIQFNDGGTTLGASANLTFNKATNALTLSNGNFIVGTSGKGIDFSAVVHAGSTSKVLTDYEVGTYTPTLGTTGTNFDAITYTQQLGYYIKVGGTVLICAQIIVNAVTVGAASGDLTTANLPFTNAATYTPTFNISTSGGFLTNQPVVSQFRSTTTAARLYTRLVSNNGVTVMSPANVQAGAALTLSGFMYV